MDKSTIEIIQKIAKIGRVLAKIIYICSMVGLIGCIVGILSTGIGLPVVIKLGGVKVFSLATLSGEFPVADINSKMVISAILCAGNVILARHFVDYFTRELEDGSPFTMEGSLALRRLGIITMILPIITMVIAEVVYELYNQFSGSTISDMHIDSYAKVGLGLTIIVMSLLCRYGAEQQQTPTFK